MKKHILFLTLIVAIGAQAKPIAGGPGSPILPLQPSELITYLPPTPIGWTMTSSVAGNNFSGWIDVYAERSFKQNPPPLLPPGSPPFVPATMRVHLVDTGFKGDPAASFVPPKTGEKPAGVTYLKINDFPARLLTIDDKTLNLTFLVKNRYLIEILAKNLPDDKLKKMVEAFDFNKLMAVTDTGESNLVWPVVLSHVDELNPQNTRSYPVYWRYAPDKK